jgi:hypothetical protein
VSFPVPLVSKNTLSGVLTIIATITISGSAWAQPQVATEQEAAPTSVPEPGSSTSDVDWQFGAFIDLG